MPPSRNGDGHRSARFGHGSRGFTLVEIAVIIGLLGLLSSLGLLAAKKTIRQARTAATIAQMAYLEQALVTLAAHCEGLPIFLGTGDPGLATRPRDAAACWQGPYISRWPAPTPFGTGSFQYHGEPGAPATVSAQGLSADAAAAVAARITGIAGDKGQLTAGSTGTFSVSVTLTVENYYRAISTLPTPD